MTCSDLEYMMPLYLTGELDSAMMALFERHASNCPSCRRAMIEQRALDRALSKAILSEEFDTTGLQARVVAQISQRQPNLAFAGPFRVALAIAAMLLCIVGVSSVYRQNTRYAQAQADHMEEVVIGHREWWMADEAGIRKMVAQHVTIPLQPQQLAIPGFRLLRGKECHLGDRHYIHLVYGNSTQQMSMYILAGGNGGSLQNLSSFLLPRVRTRSESGYNVTEGDAHGQRILLVGTLSPAEQQTILNDRLPATV